MEYLRNNAETTVGMKRSNTSSEFIKACCDVTKTDLTDFFEKWGFFKTGQFHIGDYANYDFIVTPEMVAETKKWIADKAYPKHKTDIIGISE